MKSSRYIFCFGIILSLLLPDKVKPVLGRTTTSTSYHFEKKYEEYIAIENYKIDDGYDTNDNHILRVYSYIDPEFEENYPHSTRHYFDSNNNHIETAHYDEDGKLFNGYDWVKKIMKYDSNNNLIKILYYDEDGSTTVIRDLSVGDCGGEGSWYAKTIFEYDSNGNEINELRYKSNDDLHGAYTSEYDLNNNLIKKGYFGVNANRDTTIEEYKVYKYDSNGNEIEFRSYDTCQLFAEKNDTTLKHIKISKYDSNNNNIESIYYYSEDDISGIYTDKFDSNNNKIETYYENRDDRFKDSHDEKYTYTYDSKNRITEYMEYHIKLEFGELKEIPFYKKTVEYWD